MASAAISPDRSASSTPDEYNGSRNPQASPIITVRLRTEVVSAGGNGRLEHLTLHDGAAGGIETVHAFALFILIGAQPNTDWLADTLVRDANGFLLTGQDLEAHGALPASWPAPRQPLPLETSWRSKSVSSSSAAASCGSGAIGTSVPS